MALANELLDLIWIILVYFEDLNSHLGFFPFALIDDSITSFCNFLTDFDLFEFDLEIIKKSPWIDVGFEVEVDV